MRHLNNYILLAVIICFSSINLNAQNRIQQRKPSPPKQERNRENDKSEKLIDKIWFGGNIGLGLSSSQFESLFLIGLSPMVGYKITPQFSVGPRLDVSYTYFGYRTGPDTKEHLNMFSYGIGPFARFKIIESIFIHGEYQIESRAFPLITSGVLTKVRDIQSNLFLGIGYNMGGSEFVLLYNFYASNRLYLQPPFDFRFGFNYNF
jgi:hypothetical protein